jgi:hypothetical protein
MHATPDAITGAHPKLVPQISPSPNVQLALLLEGNNHSYNYVVKNT